MFDYLQQFNQLPKNLRDQVSSPLAMATITELERKYKVDLAATVMKVMIKSISLKDLASYLETELQVFPAEAPQLAQEMIDKIFPPVYDHLGLSQAKRTLDLDKDAEFIIKEAGLILPSEILINRFKNILATYLRGVRSKIDTQTTLAKDVKIGGLNLSSEDINRVFKVCSAYKFSNLTLPSRPLSEPQAAPLQVPASSKPVEPMAVPPRLAQIIAQSEQAGGYDLKQALASGQLKPLSPKPEAKEAAAPLPAPRQAAAAPKESLPALSQTKAVAKAPETRLATTSPKPLAAVKAWPRPSIFKKAATLLAGTKIAAANVSSVKAPVVAVAGKSEPKVAAQPVVPQTSPAPTLQNSPAKPVPVPQPSPVSPTPVKPQAASVPKPAVKATSASPAASRVAPASPSRPVMRDITPLPKVMGPIDELRFLDLVNFRRLGATPGEAVNKIFSKIKLLERDGYDKMIAGVRAWRQSPVNRLYIRLGQEALVKNLPLKEIISERKKSGQDCLSQEEVTVIIALNSKLVF